MPLTETQKHVLALLLPNRRAESHLAGGTAINRSADSIRFSADIDLFHDSPEIAATSAEKDAELLLKAGYQVDWLERRKFHYRAQIRRGAETLKMEWCQDSPFRFFPVQPDAEFGYCLHPADLATNKALALGGRAEIRDFIDILFLDSTYLSLGALCWAACGKDPGFTPLSLLDNAKRHMKFRDEDLAKEKLAKPITLPELKTQWLRAVEGAENLISHLPLAEVGCLYLTQSSAPVTPLPEASEFAKLIRHYGSNGGAWPIIA